MISSGRCAAAVNHMPLTRHFAKVLLEQIHVEHSPADFRLGQARSRKPAVRLSTAELVASSPEELATHKVKDKPIKLG